MAIALQNFKDSLSGAKEERVEVNQRHLIDKILARYSTEHTIFRELFQNSNDAGATSVSVDFISKKESRIIALFTKEHAESIIYKNNGAAFSQDDFNRLRKIAEGNPDEQKIGFFGVGFYSLFSICEEPFVTSGEDTMGFFWKGDMLYTKRGKLPPESQSEWTTFFLKCREPVIIPVLSI
jgi:HSP90 family molecular chaperone